jgi:hypothetical protein
MEIVHFESSTRVLSSRPFRVICSCVLMLEKTARCTWQENYVYSGNVDIVAMNDDCKMFVRFRLHWIAKSVNGRLLHSI